MSINRISLYHLETLIWISRLGTFAAAAEQLHTTQPAISARMTELEERLGARLFQRNGRLMMLTPAGRALVSDYQPIWEQLQGALLRSAQFDRLAGNLRIGAGEIAAATCLPFFISHLKAKWPELVLEIDIQLTAQMIQDLISGKIDLAFAAGSVAHPGLVSYAVGAVDLIWIANPAVADRLRNQQDAQPMSVWSLPKNSPLHMIAKDSLSSLVTRRTSLNLCNNVRTMIDIVAMGSGLALVPRSMVQAQLHSGVLEPVLSQVSLTPLMFHVVARAAEGEVLVQEVLKEVTRMELNWENSST